MLRTRLLALTAAVAALALPAAAWAQSPGTDQYQDPLAGTHSGSTKHHSSSGSPNTSTSQSTSPSTPSSAPAATTTSTPSTSASAQTSSAKQLPRTGFELLLPIELGLAMLLAGVTLQRVVTLSQRR